MGEIETVVDAGKDLTLVTARGKITVEDLIKTAERYLSDTPTRKVLWHCLEADASEITGPEFERFQQTVSGLSGASSKRRIAIVVSRELGYGLSRLCEAYAEISGVRAEYYVTYMLEEAMAWLNEEKE